jgi:peptidyl-prolyl cis-trans isomerase D
VALFTVEKVTPGDDTTIDDAQRDMLQQQLEQVAGIDDSKAYTRNLRKRMTVTVMEENL